MNRIPLTLIVLINGLFVYKYSARIWSPALVTGLVFVGLSIVLIKRAWRIHPGRFHYGYITAFLVFFLIACLTAFDMIPVEGLQNDRWSVIKAFWDAVFSGLFPYSTTSISGSPPGPFPMYFLLALPFHLVGEIGLFTLAGLGGFIYLTFRMFPDLRTRTLLVLILSLSPGFLYEVLARSTIIVNMVIVLGYLIWFHRLQASRHRILAGVGFVGGLVLSTRGIAIIPVLMYVSHLYIKERKWIDLAISASGIAAGFIVSLLPLVIWDWGLFLEFNPLALQAGMNEAFPTPAPFPVMLLLTVGAIYLGTRSGTFRELINNIGIILFLIVTISFCISLVSFGWDKAFFQSWFDITYFLFPIPFLLVSLPKEEIISDSG